METIETEYGTFTNNEVTGETAQEVLDNWLTNKNKPQSPTNEERLNAIENALTILMGV